MNEAKISVIVPAYNAESTIEKCLHSILNGRYTNIEVIVINDGSTDNTESLIKAIADEDIKVKVISQSNHGVAFSRNIGLKNATGEYIAWCDADDWVEPTWLEDLYHLSLKEQTDISICRCTVGESVTPLDGSITVLNREAASKLFLEHQKMNGSMVNKLIKTLLYDSVVFNEELSYFEDDLVFWNILKKANRICTLNKQEYHLIPNANSLTSIKCNAKRVSSISAWQEIYTDCLNDFPELINDAARILSYQSYHTILAMFRGDYIDKQAEKQLRSVMKKHKQGVTLCQVAKHKLLFYITCYFPYISKFIYSFR